MIELRQCPGFASEAFGKGRIIADAGRQDLECNNAVELLLTRLVHRAHAAFANEFQYLKLRKKRCEVVKRGRLEGRLIASGNGVAGSALLQQAGGAKPGQRATGQRRAALRAFILCRGVRGHFRVRHTPFSTTNRAKCYRGTWVKRQNPFAQHAF